MVEYRPADEISAVPRPTDGTIPVTNRVQDEPCFVTNTPSVALERTFLIDARPRPKYETRADKIRKKKVVTRMKNIGVVHSTFNLEHKSNQTMLSPFIQCATELYDLCAIVPSRECLLGMTELVISSNVTWAQARLDNPKCDRTPFDLLDAALVNPEYQLLVLFPNHLLQRTHIVVYPDEAWAYGDGPTSNFINYAFIDGALREFNPPLSRPSSGDATLQASSSPPPIFGPFRRRHNREDPLDNSNPFLHVLKAHIALRRFRRTVVGPKCFVAMCPEYEELINLTCRLAELIYFDEPTVTGVQGSAEVDNGQPQMGS